ncbi:MAG: GxxExxY protein [Candidatus Hydrogenedentes bacterium]|nr:GxxExxY protein [Candidatus Hydrogenedentota bacterium]
MSEERDPQTYAILGACYAVHGEKACGFFEPVYHECLEIEFNHCGIPFVHECPFPLDYRNMPLQSKYFAGFVCYSEVIVELKAVDKLTDKHVAQTINYLKASGLRRALLVNFGTTSLEFKRIVR